MQYQVASEVQSEKSVLSVKKLKNFFSSNWFEGLWLQLYKLTIVYFHWKPLISLFSSLCLFLFWETTIITEKILDITIQTKKFNSL